MLTLEEERLTWVVYCNIHILTLGGVPVSKDMEMFAPNLWKENSDSPCAHFVWNDCGIDPERYINKTTSIGHFVKGLEPTNAVRIVEDERQRRECWEEAKSRVSSWRPGSMTFDTSGFSCRGIVPRRPPDLE